MADHEMAIVSCMFDIKSYSEGCGWFRILTSSLFLFY